MPSQRLQCRLAVRTLLTFIFLTVLPCPIKAESSAVTSDELVVSVTMSGRGEPAAPGRPR